MNGKTKTLDCVEMKRRIQEKIYEETKNMRREEYLAFVRRRVDEGPFGKLLSTTTMVRRKQWIEHTFMG